MDPRRSWPVRHLRPACLTCAGLLFEPLCFLRVPTQRVSARHEAPTLLVVASAAGKAHAGNSAAYATRHDDYLARIVRLSTVAEYSDVPVLLPALLLRWLAGHFEKSSRRRRSGDLLRSRPECLWLLSAVSPCPDDRLREGNPQQLQEPSQPSHGITSTNGSLSPPPELLSVRPVLPAPRCPAISSSQTASAIPASVRLAPAALSAISATTDPATAAA